MAVTVGRSVGPIGQLGSLAASGQPVVAQPRLREQLDQLEGLLDTLSQLAGRVEQAAARIVMQGPAEAGSNALPESKQHSLEQRLAVAITRAEVIAENLGEAADQLDRAV